MSTTAVRTINNTAITVGSNVAIKVFSFFSTIVIARHVEISEFGSFAFVVTVMTLLSLLIDLGISTVIVKEGSQDFAKLKHLFPTALMLRLIWGGILVLSTILLLAFSSQIPQKLTLMYLFYLLSVIPNGVISLIGAVFTAKEKIYLVSIINFIVSVLISLSSIVIVFLGGDLNAIAVSAYIFLIIQIILLFEFQRRIFFDISYKFDYQLAKSLILRGIPFMVIALQTVL